MNKEDMREAWSKTLPALKTMGKVFLSILGLYVWIMVGGFLVCISAWLLVLFVVGSFVAGIFTVNYLQVLCERESEAQEKAWKESYRRKFGA